MKKNIFEFEQYPGASFETFEFDEAGLCLSVRRFGDNSPVLISLLKINPIPVVFRTRMVKYFVIPLFLFLVTSVTTWCLFVFFDGLIILIFRIISIFFLIAFGVHVFRGLGMIETFVFLDKSGREQFRIVCPPYDDWRQRLFINTITSKFQSIDNKKA